MNRALRAVTALVLFATAGWAGVKAFEVGTAGTLAFESAQEVNVLTATPAKASVDAWSRVHGRLAGAEGRAADPAIHELLGVVDMQPGRAQEYLAEADVHFMKALELRPTSPYTWSNLAAARYRQGDTGAIFEKALVRAAAMGPHEPEVQRNVANLGLAVWNEVAPATRSAIDTMVAAGMKRKPAELLQIAERRGRLQVACRHLAGSTRPTDPKWSQLCQSSEATS